MESYPLVIPSRGSKLIGGTIRAELTRQQLTALLVDGFFPQCAVSEQPRQPRRTGLSEVGLPYAADAGITRHLAYFLTRQAAGDSLGDFVKPTAVLFNGGVLKADILRDRVTQVINDWLTQAGRPGIKVLDIEVLMYRLLKVLHILAVSKRTVAFEFVVVLLDLITLELSKRCRPFQVSNRR